MGNAKFDPGAYGNFQKHTAGKSTDQIFTQRSVHKDLNPHGVKVRESRDSAVNPTSNPIIVGIDVTGSMGMLADTIARQGLGTLFEEIYAKKPVTDPHIMFMGIGDVRTDTGPLQVSQFEAGPQIIEQLANIWIEHGGGGNNGESYQLPWYFAAFHTTHDAYEKRAKRGYLFTIGDEEAPVDLTPSQIERVTGDSVERNLSPQILLQMAERTYKVFHLVVEESQHIAYNRSAVYHSWSHLLGERVLPLKDHTKLAEVIISAIAVSEGHDVSSMWTGMTAKVVHEAVKRLPRDI